MQGKHSNASKFLNVYDFGMKIYTFKGGYFKDERSLEGRAGQPNAVSISNNDIRGGRGSKKNEKLRSSLKHAFLCEFGQILCYKNCSYAAENDFMRVLMNLCD